MDPINPSDITRQSLSIRRQNPPSPDLRRTESDLI